MIVRIFVNPEALRAYLTKRGMKQCRLAVKIGVSPSTVTRWLTGERAVSPDTANKVRDTLRLPWDEVFGRIETGETRQK